MADPRLPLDAAALDAALLAPRGPLARLDVVARSGSTNTDLVEAVRAAPDAWPVPALLVADHQDAGRGRAGRTWQTPPRAAVTASLLIGVDAAPERLPWLPLLVGLGVVRGLAGVTGLAPVVKWPNDVLVPAPDGTAVDGWGARRKLVGILVEGVPGVPGRFVAGFGVNVSQTGDELPVPSATSLALSGSATTDRGVVLEAVVRGVLGVLDVWVAAGGDARAPLPAGPLGDGAAEGHAAGAPAATLAAGAPAATLADAVADACVSVGARVAVDRVDGTVLHGDAVGLGAGGELLVRDDLGREHAVVAGDVRHVRSGGADTLAG